MKIFSQSGTLFGIISLAFVLGGCGTTDQRDTDTVIGGKIGGVAGMLPAGNGVGGAGSGATTNTSGAKTSGAKNATGNPAAK